jgi:hypothetical protein
MVMRIIDTDYIVFNARISYLRKLALKLQKYLPVTKVQIKVVLLPLNIKLINIDEEKI